ncbi:MAG: ATP-binding protein, partial [Alphaproteobacteria bacterium]
EKYLARIRPFYHDASLIKVLTGVRRCGKSTIMRQIISELSGNDIVYLDLDSKENIRIVTSDVLEKKIDGSFSNSGEHRFLFIDEIQNVKDFEPLINAYRNDGVSVFITGSNSYLLSGQLVTKLTGRFLEFPIFPFSFSEVRDFKELNGLPFSSSEEFRSYIVRGGFPQRFMCSGENEQMTYIRQLVDESIEKDILKLRKVRNRPLLKKVLGYVASSPGAEISSVSISKYLRTEKINTLPNTINRYMDLIFASKLALRCDRFDVIEKKVLKTFYKSYVADPAVYSFYPDYRHDLRIGAILENIVYLELVSRGYNITVGKLRDKEIDFVVTEGENLAYVQVTYVMDNPETEVREERPLLAIKDGYPKYIISMDPVNISRNGIKRLNMIDDFLLGDKFVF